MYQYTTCLSATSFKIWTFSAFLYIAETISTNFVKISSHNLHNVYNKYTLFTGWEVRIMRNCAQGLESAARRCRPRAVLRPRAQFLPIRTDLGRSGPVNNIFIFFPLRFKSFRKISLQPSTYECWSRARSCWYLIQSARSIANQNKTWQHDFNL